VVGKNTTILGLTTASGTTGGTFSLSSTSNVAIRNLHINDAYDPFPHHEDGDGFNAQYDGMTLQGTNANVWIDHCTFQDTISTNPDEFNHVTLSDGTTSEKWQTYDGFCDIKGTQTGITVSWCKFQDHDKTMLIGSSDTETGAKTITLAHNWYYGCVQRLPMVRIADIHIVNNYYSTRDGGFTNSYGVGVRKNSRIVAENNYFDTGMATSFRDSDGTLYASGNEDHSSKGVGTAASAIVSTKPWDPTTKYTLTLDDAADVPARVMAGAGAGVGTVVL
jgi:pectate lyase